MILNFFVCNLRIFLINWRLCPWQAFLAYSNKHSSLVRKVVIYEKGFIALIPGYCGFKQLSSSMYKGREILLKWKALNYGPPCTN